MGDVIIFLSFLISPTAVGVVGCMFAQISEQIYYACEIPTNIKDPKERQVTLSQKLSVNHVFVFRYESVGYCYVIF